MTNGEPSTKMIIFPSRRSEAALSGRSVNWVVGNISESSLPISCLIFPASKIPSILIASNFPWTFFTSSSSAIDLIYKILTLVLE